MDKIIIFDAYGTLFKVNTENELLNSILGVERARFLSLWRNKLLEYSWLTSLMDEYEGFNCVVDKALKYSCKVYKYDYAQIQPILLDIYKNPTTFENVLPILPQLNAKCCIMSNGELETLEEACEKTKLSPFIDKIFSASEVEKFKVSRQVYRMATAHYNIGPGNIFFVSSNSWDITGAKSFGYKTVWVNRSNNTFDTLVEEPDYEIRDLLELVQLVNT